MGNELDERSLKLLTLLIERYIQEGQPIGSKILAQDERLSISPATIRSIMAELEAAGYLTSPHTSAGRVPTEQGYRLFVDNLIVADQFNEEAIEVLSGQLNPHQNLSGLMNDASHFLSNVTHLAGLVTIPNKNSSNLRHVEFLPLSQNRILVILVFNTREVQNRIIHVDRAYTESELQQAANLINAEYAGEELLSMRQKLLNSMQADRQKMNKLMQTVLDVADQLFKQENTEEEYIVAGQSHLLGLVDTTGIEKLQSLFEAFTQKRTILHLLDKCFYAKGLQIFIGKEAGHEAFNYVSIVTAPYEKEGQVLGVLGVIGPTRMHYDKVISIVNMTSRLLSAALQD